MIKELKYILAILKARFNEPRMVFSFSIKFKDGKQDNWWEAIIRYGVPETCACVYYIGKGGNEIEAVEDCIEKVLSDKQLETEIG